LYTEKEKFMPTIKQQGLRSRIYIEIVSKIVLGAFPKGHHLVEEELAETYGVSRTPIREVLLALEKDGLVERAINRAAVVASFTPDDVEQIYDVRNALECLAVRCANRNLKLNDLLQFERRLEALSTSDPATSSEAHVAIDIELHQLIISHARNRWLSGYMENISMLTHALRLMGHSILEDAYRRNEEHLGIVRALLRRDGDLAEKLLAAHIELSKKIALQFFIEKMPQEQAPAPIAEHRDRRDLLQPLS
jgi:DNA-binding GntR family transcriptional regulator